MNRSIRRMTLLSVLLPATVLAFGGEELPNGNPWHHYDITRRAAAGDVCFLHKAFQTANPPTRCKYRSQASSTMLPGHSPQRETTTFGAGANYAPAVVKNLYGGAGFTRDAAEAMSWHADWVDSYLYNPIFWMEGLIENRNLKRTKVAFASREALVKLHFDDNFSIQALTASWNRYADGTLLALIWAADNYRKRSHTRHKNTWLHAGFNALGTGLHAMQDFYSHTTWLDDPWRRDKTWLNLRSGQRNRLSMFSGAYEVPHVHGPAAHGDFGFACSFFSRRALKRPLSAACSGISPMHSSGMCKKFKACKNAVGVNMRSFGVEHQSALRGRNLLYLLPAGMNLDNTVLAQIGVTKRRGMRQPHNANAFATKHCSAIVNREVGNGRMPCVTRLSNGQKKPIRYYPMFANTKHLAIRMTEDWLLALDGLMAAEARRGKPWIRDYWNALKAYRKPSNEKYFREAQYEQFRYLPYQFMTAGKYPAQNTREVDGVYLRMEIKTANRSKAGTDGDIKVHVPGVRKPILLDFAPTQPQHSANKAKPDAPIRLLAYNDFERNTHASYVIGPFKKVPSHITLENGDANALDVMKGIFSDVKNTFKRLGPKLKRMGLAIIAGNADHINTNSYTWSRAELDKTRKFSIGINGGKEGHYRLYGTIKPTGYNKQGWRKFRIHLHHMHCKKEAHWREEKGNSDEPFFVIVVSDLGSNTSQHKIAGPYNDVDTGEKRRMNHGFNVVVPPYGYVTMAVKGMESDHESAAMRRSLAREFATGISDADRLPRGKFLDALGRAIAPDWQVDFVRVTAFRRGQRLGLGNVGGLNSRRWVKGGQKMRINLNPNGMKTLGVSARRAFIKKRPLFTPFLTPKFMPPKGIKVQPMKPIKGIKIKP